MERRFVCLERRFVAERDSCQVRTVTREHELTRLLTGDRLYKSFFGRFDLTPASPDNVTQALGIRLCDCRCSRSDSAGIQRGVRISSASWNRRASSLRSVDGMHDPISH